MQCYLSSKFLARHHKAICLDMISWYQLKQFLERCIMKTIHVVAAIIERDGHVLATQRGYGEFEGGWEFPGGKLEAGETPEQCLARELREELRIEAKIGEYLAENSHDYDFGIVHLSVYRVLSWQGEIALTVHDDMRWVPVQELAELPGLLPADVPVARALEKKLGASSKN